MNGTLDQVGERVKAHTGLAKESLLIWEHSHSVHGLTPWPDLGECC